MTTEEKLLKLVQRLEAKTTLGEIRWERTAVGGVFQVALPSYIVKLSTTPNNDNPEASDYVISIFNEAGALIESTSDLEILSAFPRSDAFAVMTSLYKMARRQALGVDAALDSLLTEIDKSGDREDSPLTVEREILEAIKRLTAANRIAAVRAVIGQTSLGRSATPDLKEQRWRFERLKEKRMIKIVGENSSGEFGVVLDAKGQERLNVPEKLFQNRIGKMTTFAEIPGTLNDGSKRYPRSVWHCQYEPPMERVEDPSDHTNEWLKNSPTSSITGRIRTKDGYFHEPSELLTFESDDGGLKFEFTLDRDDYIQFGRWL